MSLYPEQLNAFACVLNAKLDTLIAEAKAIHHEICADKQPPKCCPKDYWLVRENDTKPWTVLSWEPNVGLHNPSRDWQVKRVREVC